MAEGSALPGAESLVAAARAAAEGRRGLPPVEKWNPPYCGELDMRIAADGTWFYLGTPIGRPELVRLFSTILRREGDDYFLVTPVEKVKIRVDDAPFVAVDFEREPTPEGPAITFVTNVGDVVTAGPGHEIRVEHRPGRDGEEPRPYVHVRAGLWALIDRKSFYRLVELGEEAEHDGERWFGLRSRGVFYPVLPAQALA